ncbi:right-handed parallel beta-helix repeat-containing protein [Hymenobacter sp. BT491]|uniref:right-handed parallel beta-helix repeat-containing protein n=1 Tax=Hymenobacter sp. BT491 TaxID=2766779 RepID=UPI0016537F4A|nr:right-handed parallel beta-helix repeat-containing protein [Hymenobacter sp. BT491]MBC6991285.1 right-handed parallel beta-helix repeat-containing protein [Hymenobacter sp. BT491]
MRTRLRLASFLLVWLAVGTATVHAATAPAIITPTITNPNLPGNNGITLLVSSVTATLFNDADGNTSLSSYRFTTLPTAGVLYAYNISSGEKVAVTSTAQTFSPFQYPSIAYDPATVAATTTYSFQYQATDETGLTSATGTYNIPVTTAARVNQVPATREVTNQVVAKGFGASTLAPGLFGVDTDGSVDSYLITAVPNAATVGVLRIGATGTQLAANATVTAAEAAQLTFDPVASFFGTAIIQYKAVDNNGIADATAANYAIPVSNVGSTFGSVLDFTTRPIMEDWSSTSQSLVVNGTTVSISNYTGSGPETNLHIEDNPTMPGRALTWTADYINGKAAAAQTASVTFSFSKAVSGFSASFGDIDLSAGAWTDQLIVTGKRADGTTVALTAANFALGTVVTFSGNNTLTGNAGSSTADDNTVVTFPEPIVSVTFAYANVAGAANPAQQLMTFESFAWYTPDVVTTLTGPARVNPNTAVTYVASVNNNGPYTATSVAPTVQLIAGLTNVTVNGAAAGTSYSSASGLLTLPVSANIASGATVTYNVGFTIGTSTVTGTARSTATSSDEVPSNNNGTQSDAQVTTVVNQVPVAQNVTAPTMSNTNNATAIPALVASDPDGDNTIASFLLTNLPATTQGVVTYTRAGATITLAAGNTSSVTNRTLTPAEMATLQFDPAATAVAGSTPSFNYAATDDLGLSSAAATYKLPIAATGLTATDLSVTQQVNLGPYQVGDQVTFTVTAGNTGVAATGVQVTDALPAGLTFVSATPSTGTYDNTTGIWTIVSGVNTFASGSSATLSITATIAKEGTFTNVSTITASNPDSNPLNNEASQKVNPGTAAYAQDFEGRTATDYCEIYTGMSLSNTSVLSDNNSLITNAVLSTTAAGYATPLLRMSGSTTVTFLARVTATTNTARYRLALLDAAGTRTVLTAFTAFGNTAATSIMATISQVGVYRVEISFDAQTNGGSNGTAILDDLAVSNATVATQSKNGSDCTANTLPVANDVTFRIANGAAATTIPSLAGTDTAPGVIDSYVFESVLDPNTQGSLTLNGVLVKIGQIVTVAEAAALKFDPVAGYVGSAAFQFSALDNSNEQSAAPATYTISVENSTTIAGRVYDDVNYGGGAGRDYATANAAATGSGFTANAISRSGAVLELYDLDSGKLINTVATGTDGTYTFPLVVSGNYDVRVVNSTVTSVRNATAAGVVPVQTYVNGDVNRIGGENPLLIDAAQNTGTQLLPALTLGNRTPQSLAGVTISSALVAATNVDFGFNFDAVVNTNDAGQGSLRQFIVNANALPNNNLNQVAFNGTAASGTTAIDPAAGVETAIFMLNDNRTTGVPAGLRTGVTAAGYSATTKQFTITLASALPTLIDASTAIDGKEQTVVTGNNVAAGAETTTGPEVVIDFNSFKGLEITGASTRIASLGLTNAKGDGSVTQGAAVYVNGAATSVITDVTATGNDTGGIRLNAATTASVTNNVILGTATQNASADGIQVLGGTTGASITGNTLSSNRGYGLEFISGANTSNTVSGNIIRSNGAGIAIAAGSGNTFSTNTITGNAGDGIVALSGTFNNVFSQNAISTNGDLGIDLSATTTATGDGVSKNADSKTTTSGANSLLNFPIVTQAVTNATNLEIAGYAPAGSTIELFVASADASNFGEGFTFITSQIEGSTSDGAKNARSYSGLINGIDQGSETNASAFYFVIPLSTLSAAQRAALTTGSPKVTATATKSGTGTSEFSGLTTVGVNKPLPVELALFEVKAARFDAQLKWQTATEKNNDHFEVERSFDGITFEKVANVRGNGTTSEVSTYAFTDANVAQKHLGTVYYRLKQVEASGSAQYSLVRTTAFTQQPAASAELYPNPATTTSTLDLAFLPAGTYQVVLVDMTGRTVSSNSTTASLPYTLNVQALPKGTYMVIIRGGAINLTKRLVKE